MMNETFSVIFQHLNCILVSTLARWDDQRDDVNQQAWEQPRKKSSQIGIRKLYGYATTTQLKSVCQNASVSKAVKDYQLEVPLMDC